MHVLACWASELAMRSGLLQRRERLLRLFVPSSSSLSKPSDCFGANARLGVRTALDELLACRDVAKYGRASEKCLASLVASPKEDTRLDG